MCVCVCMILALSYHKNIIIPYYITHDICVRVYLSSRFTTTTTTTTSSIS